MMMESQKTLTDKLVEKLLPNESGVVKPLDEIETIIFTTGFGNSYLKTLDEYMVEYHEPGKEELLKTSVMFPQPLRLMIQDMCMEYNRSEYKISRCLIEHGFFIIQHKHLEKFKIINTNSRKYSFGNLTLIKDILNDFEFNVSDLIKPKKLSIQVRENIYYGIVRAASWIHLDTADLIRLCIIYSLLTKETLYPEIKEYCKKEVEKFEIQLKEWTAILEHIPAIKETFDKL